MQHTCETFWGYNAAFPGTQGLWKVLFDVSFQQTNKQKAFSSTGFTLASCHMLTVLHVCLLFSMAGKIFIAS